MFGFIKIASIPSSLRLKSAEHPRCGVLILISSFSLSRSSQKKQDNKAPDKEAILKATASLSTRHTDRTVTQHNIRDVRFMQIL